MVVPKSEPSTPTDSEPCALLGARRELRPDHTADWGWFRHIRQDLVCHERTGDDTTVAGGLLRPRVSLDT